MLRLFMTRGEYGRVLLHWLVLIPVSVLLAYLLKWVGVSSSAVMAAILGSVNAVVALYGLILAGMPGVRRLSRLQPTLPCCECGYARDRKIRGPCPECGDQRTPVENYRAWRKTYGATVTLARSLRGAGRGE